MKNLVYILFGFAAVAFTACDKDSGYDEDTKGAKTTPTVTPKDTVPNTPGHEWETVVGQSLPIDEDMMATPWIKFNCTDGKVDSVQMEPWLMYIHTEDMTIYRDSYQSTSKSGITPNAERSSSDPYIDKFGNTVQRHSYTQPFKFNNFTHSISSAWNTGYLTYNGKQENFWPEDGIYYELVNISGNTVNDTVHFVRNDSIFARENVKLTYKVTLHVVAGKPQFWQSWERTATVTVISFVGKVIPSAEEYAEGLNWHAVSGNRLFKKIGKDKDGDVGYWEDGFLMSSDTHYYMLIVHYTVDAKDGKSDERYVGKEVASIPKSEMATPSSDDRAYNGVMYDYDKKQYIPCHLSEDHSFRYGSRYSDGTGVNFLPDINGSIMGGVKNFAKTKDANPTPWLETSCSETSYDGKNYYTITLRSSVHTNVTTVADSNLKK